jgi:hypothetical protein
VGEQVSSEGGQAVVWLVMVEEARPEVGLSKPRDGDVTLHQQSHLNHACSHAHTCSVLLAFYLYNNVIVVWPCEAVHDGHRSATDLSQTTNLQPHQPQQQRRYR